MRQLSLLSAAALGAAAFAGQALAADLPSTKAPVVEAPAATSTMFDVAFGVKYTSNYGFRGISQSNGFGVAQGYAELQFFDNFFYVNGFASKVDLPTKATAETDVGVGIRPKFGPLTFDIGFIQYAYPGERRFMNPFSPVTYVTPSGTFDGPAILSPKNSEFGEVHAAVTATFDGLTLGAGVYHSWDFLGLGTPATYYNGTVKYSFPAEFMSGMKGNFYASGELGYFKLGTVAARLGGAKLKSYTTWNVGAGYTYENLTVDLRYVDTNLSKQNCFLNTTDPAGFMNGGKSNWCSAAFVATVSLDFTYSGLQKAFASR